MGILGLSCWSFGVIGVGGPVYSDISQLSMSFFAEVDSFDCYS